MKNEQAGPSYLGDPDAVTTYAAARDRFEEAARYAGARLEKVSIDSRGPSGDELSIDLALVGDPAARSTVVVTSGLHGVEGFFGSMIQVAWMRSLAQDELPEETSIVLIHALNPYGFAWRRRCDEQNIDLNRNYLLEGEPYSGAPPGYAELHDLLNPRSPPRRFEAFRLRALRQIRRHGLEALKNAIAVGQYEYPAGLFYGGSGPAESTRIVQENFSRWIGGADRVVHVDLHSGLGRSGSYKVLVPPGLSSRDREWYEASFGPDEVEPLPDGIAYPARGVMGAWLRDHLADRDYRFAGAEFGTHSILRVLSALRAENRAHHYSRPGEPAYERAKRELVECFCPRRFNWRMDVLVRGLDLIGDALTATQR